MTDKTFEKFDALREIIGTDELLENLAKAVGNSELEECISYIARMYDVEDEVEEVVA